MVIGSMLSTPVEGIETWIVLFFQVSGWHSRGVKLPFSPEQFFHSFSEYNLVVGPWIWPLYLVAILIFASLALKKKFSARGAMMFLGFLWILMGVLYHWLIFSKINPAARFFAILFVAQGGIFLWAGFGNWVDVRKRPDGARLAAAVLFSFFALVVYPLLGWLNGHAYPDGPIFGLPCPTTIFTFGTLMLLQGSKRSFLLLSGIPIIWSFIGTFAAISMGVYQDFFLIPVAVVGLFFIFGQLDLSEKVRLP